MHREPLPVTAVIPAYRRPLMVERAIRSVLAQRRPPAEVIVVDDGSGDDTAATAESLGARVITHERNLGVAAARNTGLRAARHDWVALLDCDDEWLPWHLEVVWPARDGHAVVASAVLCTGGGEHRIYGWTGRRPLVLKAAAAVALPENKLPTSSVLVRRDDALAAGGFRVGMHYSEDLELWMRVAERSSALAIPRMTALYHVHSGQLSADRGVMRSGHREALLAHADDPSGARAIRYHEAIVAWDEARSAVARGSGALPEIAALTKQVGSRDGTVALVQLLAGRLRGRRSAARFTPTGGLSLAIMPGARPGFPAPPDAVDLRGRTWTGALLHLVRRPTAHALTHGRLQAALVRLIGVEPVAPA